MAPARMSPDGAAAAAALAAFLVALAAGTVARAAVSEVPSNPAAMGELERAALWVEEGRFAPALAALRPLVLAEPGNADAWSLLGFALRKSGDPALALAAYERALALEPLHRGANEYLGELWLERGEPDRARARLDALAAACPAGCEERAELEAAIVAAPPAAARGDATP